MEAAKGHLREIKLLNIANKKEYTRMGAKTGECKIMQWWHQSLPWFTKHHKKVSRGKTLTVLLILHCSSTKVCKNKNKITNII